MKTIAHIAVQKWTVNTMRGKFIKILQDMSRVAFTNEEKADYLLQHDVAPVVRCKDCKHVGDIPNLDDGSFVKYCMGRSKGNIINLVGADDFCSYGERKANNG